MNPLYGRDAYAGCSRVRRRCGRRNILYNLADFMLGLRSQYALSNVLIANLRQHMHFAYVQDDLRVNDALTLNLGLRYEYATPHWERDNILSNFDPATRTMVPATDGSLGIRSTINPDRNNFGPRLGFAYSVTAADGGARRLRHQLRALPSRRRRQHPADQRTAGHQRRRLAGRPAGAVVPHDAAGLPGWLHRPVGVQSARARTSRTCREDYQSSRVQS